MKVALVTVLGGAPADLDVFLSYHRSAGVDVVVLGGRGASSDADTLARHEREGFVRAVDSVSPSDLARIAVEEFSAEWILPGAPDEYWWPRGESFEDVLAVIPPRYGVVQALVRAFVPEPASSHTSPAEVWTTRSSLLGPDGAKGAPLEELLRPVYRASADMTLDAHDWTLGGRRVPLRAWYPIEVFRFSPDQKATERSQRDALIAEGSLAVDTRLQNAVRAGTEHRFSVPTIVDDASYAVECAAVGEVDLVGLDRQIRALEQRIGELEARFWPSVQRRLRRLARRPR